MDFQALRSGRLCLVPLPGILVPPTSALHLEGWCGLPLQEQHKYQSPPPKTDSGDVAKLLNMALPGLVVHLYSVQNRAQLLDDCAMHPFWTFAVVPNPHILLCVKGFQLSGIGLKQLLVDLPSNIRFDQVQPGLNISPQKQLCGAQPSCGMRCC